MPTLDFVSVLHNYQEFFQPLECVCLYEAMQPQEKSFPSLLYNYKITFPRKKKNSLFRLLIKREILASRSLVISSWFAIKMQLSKKRFFPLKFHPTREWANEVQLSSFQLKNILKFVLVWLAREEQNILTPHVFTYPHANTSLGQSEPARTILVICKRCYQLCSSLFDFSFQVVFNISAD